MSTNTATPTLEWMELDPLQFDPKTRAAFDLAVEAGRERDFLFDLVERGYVPPVPPTPAANTRPDQRGKAA